MNTAKLSPWLMLAAACACIAVGCVIALRRPNQWKALLVLLSFALVCFGVLPASQWLTAWCQRHKSFIVEPPCQGFRTFFRRQV